MRRVVVMLSPTRKSVVKRSIVGKDENSRGDFTYIAIMSIMKEIVRLAPMKVSTSAVGIGRIMSVTTMTRSATIARSLWRVIVSATRPAFRRNVMVRSPCAFGWSSS